MGLHSSRKDTSRHNCLQVRDMRQVINQFLSTENRFLWIKSYCRGFSDRTNYSKHKKTHLKRDAALQNILGEGETTGSVLNEKSAVKEEFLKVEALSNDPLTESCSEMVAMTDQTAEEVKTIEVSY